MCSMLFGFSEYLGGSGGLDTAHADIEMLSLQIVSLQIVEVGGKRVTVLGLNEFKGGAGNHGIA